MKQTAVEWFAQQLGITSGTMLEKAKAMERRQIITAFCTGYDHDGDNYDSAETIYYEETYGGEK